MGRPQVPGHRPGIARLIVVLFLKADREGPHRVGRAGLHQRDDGGRVHAARQKSAQRHVGHHLLGHGLPKHPVQDLHRVLRCAHEAPGFTILDDLAHMPVARGRRQRPANGMTTHREPGPRHQLVHTLVDRVRRGNGAKPHQQRQGGAIHRCIEVRMGPQGLDLGAKDQSLALPAVIQRLLSNAVARQSETGRGAIPQRQGEHAHRLAQGRFKPPSLDARQQGFGVGGASPRCRAGQALQFAAPVQVVVDLAVERQHVAPRGRGHGLMAGRRQVHDGQATVRERDAPGLIRPHTCIVRPAMRQTLRHRPHQIHGLVCA